MVIICEKTKAPRQLNSYNSNKNQNLCAAYIRKIRKIR